MASNNQATPNRNNWLFRAYPREFLRFDPPAIRRTTLFSVMSAGTEHARLLMLLPLLTLAGGFETEGSRFTVAHRLLSRLKLNWDFETALVFLWD